MRALLLAALWVQLASCTLLVGAFFMLLLAGRPRPAAALRWDAGVVAAARWLVALALGAGFVWLLARTAIFENRPHAALEPSAVAHAALDTWPGLVWLAREGLLLVLAAFLATRASVADTRDWIAARGEALALAALALVLGSASSHAAALTPGTARAVAVDAAHLLGAGLWGGALVPLALLLRMAGREDAADARAYTVTAARRFSRVALGSMLLLGLTGVTSAVAQVETVAGLAGTAHGRLLLAKLGVLVPILGLAAVSRTRLLPALSAPAARDGRSAARRLGRFVAVEAVLALVVLALAAAMTLTTPARHGEPVWPLPFRLSVDGFFDASATTWRALLAGQLAVVGIVALVVSFVVRRRRRPIVAAAVALVAIGACVGLPPLVVDAYPTTYKRTPVAYQATSVASGMAIYGRHCAGCHGPGGAASSGATDLRSPRTSRRHAGDLFWLISHGIPRAGMPAFADRLPEAQRWDVINFIRALGAADGARTLGRHIEVERAWVAAPDFTIAVGPLTPGALRDHRGRRMVLLVLYTLPSSRPRMTDLARSYDVLSILGVEIIAVPTRASATALRDLGTTPPVLFPIVTDGNGEIVTTYGLFAPGPHAELLIDRQGYIRAIWRSDAGAMPEASAVQAEVEKLNAETSPPPFPDDHVH